MWMKDDKVYSHYEAIDLVSKTADGQSWAFIAGAWNYLESDLSGLENQIAKHNAIVSARGKRSIYPDVLRVALYDVRLFVTDLRIRLQKVFEGSLSMTELQMWIIFTTTELGWFRMTQRFKLAKPINGSFGPHSRVDWSYTKQKMRSIVDWLDAIHEASGVQLGESGELYGI